MLLSLFGVKYLLGLSWCAAVLEFLYDSIVRAVPNWHLRLLAFEQELHLLYAFKFVIVIEQHLALEVSQSAMPI